LHSSPLFSPKEKDHDNKLDYEFKEIKTEFCQNPNDENDYRGDSQNP